MKNRLGKIATGVGDQGQTQLASGTQVSKNAPIVKAMGDVDELNCVIGCVLAHELPNNVRDLLITVQHQLFNLGGELALEGQHHLVKQADVAFLERHIHQMNQALPPLKEFILPSGNFAIAHMHLARTVCRRAERQAIEAVEDAMAGSWSAEQTQVLVYLNRLSDVLFILARIVAKALEVDEVYWSSQRLTNALDA